MVHTDDAVCPGCQKKLLEADQELVDWFNIDVKPRHPNAHVSWAWRGPIDQELFFQRGQTNLHWPDSKHNTVENGKRCAKALDLFEQINGNAYYRPKFYNAINEYLKGSTRKIRWGGTFKIRGHSDPDHFELLP